MQTCINNQDDDILYFAIRDATQKRNNKAVLLSLGGAANGDLCAAEARPHIKKGVVGWSTTSMQ